MTEEEHEAKVRETLLIAAKATWAAWVTLEDARAAKGIVEEKEDIRRI